MTADELISKFPILSEQVEKNELRIILKELETVLESRINGDICEFGCFAGTTSLFLQRLLLNGKSNKKLYLYDSFEGLPVKSEKDHSAAGADFIPGELMASKSQLKLNFKKADLPTPKVKKAWFKDLKSKDIPRHICFAFLDGDFYESIRTPLKLIQNSMVSGGIIVVDDYDNPALPGAKISVDEFLEENNNYQLVKIISTLAVIIKL